MTDFFTKPEEKMEPTQPTETKVKIGEKEYSQEELSSLVGLGETAKEYETKWNRPISEFYPDYTQKSQKLADYERQRQSDEQAKLNEKANSGNQLTPQEARAIAIQQAKDLGIVTTDTFQDSVNQAVANAMAGQELINESKELLSQAQAKGLPKVDVGDLLSYMNGENPTGTRFGTPEKAYNDKFEKEIGTWREQQIAALKPRGMETNEQASAGSKTIPPQNTVSRETLSQAIRESLTRRQGV